MSQTRPVSQLALAAVTTAGLVFPAAVAVTVQTAASGAGDGVLLRSVPIALITTVVAVYPLQLPPQLVAWFLARRRGLDPLRVHVGLGALLFTVRPGRTPVDVRALPFSGAVVVATRTLDEQATALTVRSAAEWTQLGLFVLGVVAALRLPGTAGAVAAAVAALAFVFWIVGRVAPIGSRPTPSAVPRETQMAAPGDIAALDREALAAAAAGDVAALDRLIPSLHALVPPHARWRVATVRGHALSVAGRHREALAEYGQALALAPDAAERPVVEHAWADALLTAHLADERPVTPDDLHRVALAVERAAPSDALTHTGDAAPGPGPGRGSRRPPREDRPAFAPSCRAGARRGDRSRC